jgi:hypothetical protein
MSLWQGFDTAKTRTDAPARGRGCCTEIALPPRPARYRMPSATTVHESSTGRRTGATAAAPCHPLLHAGKRTGTSPLHRLRRPRPLALARRRWWEGPEGGGAKVSLSACGEECKQAPSFKHHVSYSLRSILVVAYLHVSKLILVCLKYFSVQLILASYAFASARPYFSWPKQSYIHAHIHTSRPRGSVIMPITVISTISNTGLLHSKNNNNDDEK